MYCILSITVVAVHFILPQFYILCLISFSDCRIIGKFLYWYVLGGYPLNLPSLVAGSKWLILDKLLAIAPLSFFKRLKTVESHSTDVRGRRGYFIE